MAIKLNMQSIKCLAAITLSFLLLNCSENRDLTGFFISPDTVNERFVQSEDWNSKHEPKQLEVATDHYTILLGGDSHIGGTKNFNALLSEAKKPENLALVMVGDLVTGRSEDYKVLSECLSDFQNVPYFMVVGNHDLFFDGWKTFYEYFGTSTYYFTVKTPTANDLYICLDTGTGTIGDKQLTWLMDILSTERNKYRNCIVLTHLNFFRNHNQLSTNPLVTELYVLLDLFAKNRVNMVISGHDHVKAINEFGNTTYITLSALLDGNAQASYLKLNIASDKLEYEFMAIK